MKQSFDIVILPGDGVGPMVIQQAMKLIQTINQVMAVQFHVITIPCGGEYYLKHQQEWPTDAFEKCRQADAILLGAVGHYHQGNLVMTLPGKPYKTTQLAGYAAVIGNRKHLNLYANVRPVKLYAGVRHHLGGQFYKIWRPDQVDYVIVRENTEDAYAEVSQTYEQTVSTAIQISRQATERIVRFAFRLARKRGKSLKVSCVDKSNIIQAHQYFRSIFTEIGQKEFPDIQRDYRYVDSFCVAQFSQPERFDVVVAPNLIGDIISDNAATTQGGLGMAPSANIGETHAMFEPIHGSAPDIQPINANPMATILAFRLMLLWLAEQHQVNVLYDIADAIEKSVQNAIQQGIITSDIQEKSTITGEAVGDFIQKQLIQFLNNLK